MNVKHLNPTQTSKTLAHLAGGSDKSAACHGKSFATKTWNELAREQGITKKKG